MMSPRPPARPSVGEAPRLVLNGRFLGQPQSGVQRFAHEISRALARVWPMGSGATVACVPPGTPDPWSAFLLETVGRRSGVAWEQLELPRAVCGGLLLNLANTAPLLAPRTQAVVIHDMGAFDVPEAYSRSFRTYYHAIQRLMALRGIRIVTVSEFSRAAIVRHLGVREEDVAVVGEGSDHMGRLVADETTLDRHGLTPGGYVLAVGNMSLHKNLGALGDLAGMLDRRGTPLVVAGQVNRIFDSGVRPPEPARYLGRVTDADLKSLYQGAACLVFPSRYEGFGLPAVEAMACGCPVVSSSAPGLAETCGDAALYFDPSSPADASAQVARLLDDPALSARLREAGAARAASFTWARAADALMDALLVPSPAADRRPIPSPPATVPPKHAESVPMPAASPVAPSPLTPHATDLPGAASRQTPYGPSRLVGSLAVGIATVGRAAILWETLREIGRQTRLPDRVVVCGASEADVAGAAEAYPGVEILIEPMPGLPAQRNRIMRALGDAEVCVFFDDDFLPAPGYLAEVWRVMSSDLRVDVATGKVLADGIGGPGLTPDGGRAILSDAPAPVPSVSPAFSAYGCNMAVRLSAVRAFGVWFDERLPLYAWQEDVDFSRRLAVYGQVVMLDAAQGVHLGVKSGRSSGVRLGYSQVANPFYLSGKRAGYPFGRAVLHVARNVAMNLAKSPRPESYVDRRGRLRGNALAFFDMVTGRMAPERASRL